MKTELALLLTHELPVMTLEEVASLQGLAARSFENKIYAGESPIPMFKIGNKWHAHITDVAKYIDDQRTGALKFMAAA